MTIENFPFPADPACAGYCLFPAYLENDPHVFFHGTAAVNFPSILVEGFKSTPPLESVSFANSSSLALKYACEKRDETTSPDGCVIVVRYEDLTRPTLVPDNAILYDYTRELPPVIIGYCIVPATYKFV